MQKAVVTIKELVRAIREITFDRFIVPAFAIKATALRNFIRIEKNFEKEAEGVEESDEKSPTEGEVSSEEATLDPSIVDNTEQVEDCEKAVLGRLFLYKLVEEDGQDIEQEIGSYPFSDYRTLEDIIDKLIEDGIIVAYTPYFKGTTETTQLIPMTKELSQDFTAFRKNFFSDEEIFGMIEEYYEKILQVSEQITDEVTSQLIRPREKHLVFWISYHLVERRRLYENAASSLGQTFTDGSNYSTPDTSSPNGASISTAIGSVFHINESSSEGYFDANFGRIGSENVWGDKFSFWYRLQCWIRQQLEEQFNDYSLRKDSMMTSHITLTRDTDFRAYYDSYPFTLSPFTRGILE